MARKTTPMDWAQTRQRVLLYACVGVASAVVVLVGFSIPLLKSLYVGGTTKHLFQPMFIGLANLAATAIGTVWWISGVPFWWAHASLPNTEQLTDPSNIYWVTLLVIGFVGRRFLNSSRHNFQTLRNGKQRAHEEHLKQARLGPPKTLPPQHIVTVNARDIHESVIGNGSGANIALNSAHNNFPDIAALVNRIHTHRSELTLTPSQFIQFEAQLTAIQEQLRAQVPNRPLLHKSLHALQHLVELGTVHMVVGHWREILHALQRLTGSGL